LQWLSLEQALSEIQELVKQGYGFALIREGTVLDTELITRCLLSFASMA
jgi:hypothetical protein